MIRGVVSDRRFPTIEVILVGADQSERSFRVDIDTGFNGDLTLPLTLIHSLGWPQDEPEEVTLADGSLIKMDLFRGVIIWKGNIRIVRASASQTQSLLGNALLLGNRLTVDFLIGGAVTIEDLDSHKASREIAPKPIIGLVGGIGSGKSQVAKSFARHGAIVITADAFGHEALRKPDILAMIAQHWGDRVLDESGNVDRKKMGAIVFASPVERTKLEALVFPWIEMRIKEEIAAAEQDPKVSFVVLDAAIMLEAGWNNACDRIVYVDAPRPIRLERLKATRGWTEQELANREKCANAIV